MNKRLIATLGLIASLGSASAADTPAPLLPRGGLDATTKMWANTSTLNGKTLADWGLAIDANTTTAGDAIPKKWIGAPTTSTVLGVAPLDSSGNSTAPVLTNSAVLGPNVDSSVIPTVYSYINPQAAYASQGDAGYWRWWDGNSVMRVGGTPITLPHSPYGDQAGTYQSIILNGSPNGGYDAGCVLCLFMEPNDVKQAAVSAEPPQGGYVPTADGVELYGAVSNANFDLVIGVSSYTATTAVLSGTLTAAELSHIQPGMTIFTNSQIPGVTASDPEAADYYMGVISSVSTTNNITTVTVYGWSQQLTTASGAVPSLTSLETYFWKGQTGPVVGIGGYNKGFGRNLFMSYEGSKAGATGNAATSLVHSYAGEEIDMHIINETRAGSVKLQANTFAMKIDAAHTNVITHDSLYTYVGGPLPTYFKTGDECYPDSDGVYDEGAYVSASSWIGGACKLGELESALNRYDQEVVEFDGRTTGLGYPYRLMYHLAENTKGGGTTQSNVTPKLGIVLDGTQGQGVSGGSLLADMQWNWNGNSGGLAICGYGVNCGLLVDGGGVTHAAPGGARSGNNLIIGAQLGGHVASLGEYVGSDYIYRLLELAKGDTTEFSVSADGNVSAAGNVVIASGKSFGLNNASGSLDGYQYLTDATSTTGPVVHQVVATENSLSGTYRVDAALDVVGAATFTSGSFSGAINTTATLSSTSGANGVIAGAQPSGHVSAIGAYRSSGYTNNLFEAMVGNNTEASLSSSGKLSVAGSVATGSYTLANLPTGSQDGEHVWCSDCTLNSVTGVEVYWHSSTSKWLDSQNNTLAN